MRRWPDVRRRGGDSGESSRPLNHFPSAVGQCTRSPSRSISRAQSTHGHAQPSEPSVWKRTTVTSGPILRRIQTTILCRGTPCRRAASAQKPKSRLSAQHLGVFVEKSSVATSYYVAESVSLRFDEALEGTARAAVSPVRNAVGHEAAVDHRRMVERVLETRERVATRPRRR
jgi:hypothetical protein